jgi:hypothetical protein
MDGMRRLRTVLVGGALVAGAAGAAPAQDASGAVEIARQILPKVEQAVGLRFKRPPDIEVRTREQVRGYLDRKLAEELPPAELRSVERAYRAFALVPDTMDLRRLMLDLYSEQVAGYYDPDSAALFVVRGADPVMVRLILAHELVHALQDQYTPLNAILKLRHQNDRQMAGQAVAEGQATLASIQVMAPGADVRPLVTDWSAVRRAIRAQQSAMPIFAGAPRIIQEDLLFPYLDGATFMRAFDSLRSRPDEEPYGDRMPVSTAQVLHPSLYRAGVMPERVAFRRPAARDTVVYDDDFGEFDTRIALETWGLGDSAATAAAVGWDGDRYEVLGSRAGTVVLWATAWTTADEADQFARALVAGWGRRSGAAGRPVRAAAATGAEYEAGARARRWRVERLTIHGVAVVRLVDAPRGWVGWRPGHMPAVTLVRMTR